MQGKDTRQGLQKTGRRRMIANECLAVISWYLLSANQINDAVGMAAMPCWCRRIGGFVRQVDGHLRERRSPGHILSY